MNTIPNTMISRYFQNVDPLIEKYCIRFGFFRRRKYCWDFIKRQWWSRMYEYGWLQESVSDCFGQKIGEKTALDVGCGSNHPGCFILVQAGFKEVDAQDCFDYHPLIARIGMKNLSYIKDDITTQTCNIRKYDLVSCISTLEHINPDLQKSALKNMCNAVLPGGAIVLTFDIPGFEYETNLSLYKDVLNEKGFSITEVEIPEEKRLSSQNGRLVYPGWPQVGRDVLFCYRIFGVKEM